MPKKAARKPDTSLSLGAQARQLLALLAEKSGMSPSAVLESAIREKAQREQVRTPGQTFGNGTEAEPAATFAPSTSVPLDLRPLAARAVAGDTAATEELRQIITDLRATATVTPAKRSEELDPEWQERFLALVEQVRRAVPGDWTAEQLDEQISEAIAEVRASRASDH
jgi:hypothetical protein